MHPLQTPVAEDGNVRRVTRAPHEKSNTHIICTIGPQTNSVGALKKLIEAGMNIARMNFSHGSHEYHMSVVNNVRKASEEAGIVVGLLLDTKGPEIRTGKLENGQEVHLKAGAKFTFTSNQDILGDETIVSTTYKELSSTVKPGDTILVDDGLIGMTVESVTETDVHTIVQNDAVLGQIKGVNLPGVIVNLPAVTEKDKEDIAFGVQNNIDIIAASFIRKASDVEEIRNLPGVRENKIMIISKIESQEGLDNFDEILAVSDGIMVARGDLGVEIPIENVANAQKMMIRKCNFAGKPVITATQMLESMIQYPRPTRAEATDVINAVYDGSDCVMLSGETAKGKFPTEAVSIMSKLARQAEINLDYRSMFRLIRNHSILNRDKLVPVPESVASSAVKSAWDLNGPLIIVLSDSGNTVRFVSKYRPHSIILCITSCARTARQVLLSRSAFPLKVDSMSQTEKLIEQGIEYALQRGWVHSGDCVVTTAGVLEGVSGSTNLMRVSIVP
eukprot:TRINITY_DN15803_c0_g1_i1.p1 TRINITY_DN15803_c0_g1~~TRINITY_DN15803_c0_g1_i1.p1  ORF type:complete len:503 (-),score=126.33 TRINITY_DN15803_c0_g1_i1:86-1594(-)